MWTLVFNDGSGTTVASVDVTPLHIYYENGKIDTLGLFNKIQLTSAEYTTYIDALSTTYGSFTTEIPQFPIVELTENVINPTWYSTVATFQIQYPASCNCCSTIQILMSDAEASYGLGTIDQYIFSKTWALLDNFNYQMMNPVYASPKGLKMTYDEYVAFTPILSTVAGYVGVGTLVSVESS